MFKGHTHGLRVRVCERLKIPVGATGPQQRERIYVHRCHLSKHNFMATRHLLLYLSRQAGEEQRQWEGLQQPIKARPATLLHVLL